MTRHERTIIAAQELPPIDAAAAINPAHDVSQIATRGHVLSARISTLTKTLAIPAAIGGLAILAASFGLIGNGRGGFDAFDGPSRDGWLQAALSYDPDTYFDIGGGLRGGPDLAWLGTFPPTPESLTAADYSALVKAVALDTQNHGTEAANWEAVGGLKTQPTITRPHKVFANNSADLKNGVVGVPEDNERVVVSAYVAGQWAFAVAFRGQCVALVGPVPEGCSDSTEREGWNSQTVDFIQTMKPQE